MPATKTLPQCAEDAIETAIDEAADEDPIVLWWDDGGYLRDVVESVSYSLGCEFHAAEQTPLELRTDAPRDRTVWYVPQAHSDDVDWFKDVENTGGVVEAHIGKLAARCFENDRIQAASIRTAYEDVREGDREQVAKTLFQELNGEGGLPTLQGLQTKIVLDGHEDPVQFVLEHGAENLPDETADLLQIRDLLVDNGVAAVDGVTDEDVLVTRTRRWAVAEWLVEEGLEKSLLDAEYRPESSSGLGISRPELQSLLSKVDPERAEELAHVYLDPDAQFWHDILRSYDDPWELADCPVDASLEHELWNEWLQAFHDGEYETCTTRAATRYQRLETTYGDVPWTSVWNQAVEVAKLAHELETWEERGDTTDVVDLYGDVDDGTWQIDNAVFNLIISGEPEHGLPEEHPARASLDDLRTSLTESRYLDYLSDLGDLVVDQIEAGSPFVGENYAHQFFDQEQEHLQSGQSVALFIVDALRFDLAHELAESVRRELPGLEVDETAWVGTLPSDTEFGKAALTPGSKFSFNIELDDGELVPERNGREITNYQREKMLKDDGWSYIMQSEDDESGWSNTRVAYYWNDLDKAGEKELTDFEALFSDRIEKISDIICEKLDQGEWDRAYILADHGFVSLPQSIDLDGIYPPDEAEQVTRRWIAGKDIDEDAPGVLLDENTHLGYLDDDTKISVLADPIQRFRNQGIPDARFYHGGVLPQEFVLNFVTITQE
ncbi:PglZ domain-containing protein [Natrinema pellirubrum DSM 15624]|uniref:PglZ domain-containing protein n=1 Tax=Natrinema pellirubrum (strain DSM 15624 / CIP 106293 / JCM 10476 / NCIMB 786 / 157) TaxID=797303 RepID=L0JU26_NATP1|nr:BREX-5 system phosphatase PglZ [Natrinema pellirubrum]AGB34142.1 PglZ domain-containing protein [Natrinema pellirubrum DSM 15624]ELY72217.1 PglZ domain-containing protein [Natrinema pellirubrum DSM 15624]